MSRSNKPPAHSPQILLRLGVLLFSQSTLAAEWAIEPQVSSYARYDDNFQLRIQDEDAVWEGAVEPKVTFARRTERSALAGSGAVTVRRFDESDLNTEDIKLGINASRSLERSRFGLDASYIKDTTLDSQLEETGVVYQRENRESLQLSPSFSYSLTERALISASLGYSKVDYDNTNESGLVDYDYRSGSLGVDYRWTERTSLSSYLSYGRYERDDNLLQSDNAQLTAGFAHQFSERFNINAAGGYRHTESDTRSAFPVCSGGVVISVTVAELLGIDTSLARDGAVCVEPDTLTPLAFTEGGTKDSSNGFVFNGSLSYRFETGTITLAASRNVVPNATDGFLISDRVTLTGDRRLSETLTAALQVSWYQSDNSGDSPTQTDRQLIRVQPSLRWQFARDWSLNTSYRYTRADYDEVSESAESNQVEVNLIYRWPRIAMSR